MVRSKFHQRDDKIQRNTHLWEFNQAVENVGKQEDGGSSNNERHRAQELDTRPDTGLGVRGSWFGEINAREDVAITKHHALRTKS